MVSGLPQEFVYSHGMTDDRAFLIGAPLVILLDRIQTTVFKGLAREGFTDLGPVHAPVFQFLSPDGDRLTELARKAHTTKQAMGYLVNYLEKQGYVRREPDPSDGRAALLVRTERGWAVNRLIGSLVQTQQAEWARLIGEDEMSQLLGLLRRLVAELGVQYEGSIAARGAQPRPRPHL